MMKIKVPGARVPEDKVPGCQGAKVPRCQAARLSVIHDGSFDLSSFVVAAMARRASV